MCIRDRLRAGNLYSDTGGRYNVVDENGNIELIDEHYSAMDSSIYEKNSFEYDKYLPAGYEARYTSLYTPFRMFANGFRTIAPVSYTHLSRPAQQKHKGDEEAITGGKT